MAALLLAEEGFHVLLCGAEFTQFDLRFLVTDIEPVFLRGQECVFGIQLFEVRQRPEPVGLEIGASGLVHSKLCTVLLPERCGVPQSREFLCKGLVLPIDHKMPAQLLEGSHAGIHVFDHRQRIVVLGLQFGNALVQGIFAGETFLLQQDECLRPAFEVELFRPTLIADALSGCDFRLNVNQFPDLVRLLGHSGLDGRGERNVLGELGKNLLFLELLAQFLGGDELYPVRRAVAQSPSALLHGDAVFLHEQCRKFLEGGGFVQHGVDLLSQLVQLRLVDGLGGLLSFGSAFCVGMVEAALSAPPRPVFPFGNMVALRFQQIDLVQVGLLAHLHDGDTKVPEHGRGAAVLLARFPVARLVHEGLPFHGADAQTADDDVDVNVPGTVVTVRVGADDGRMTGEVVLAELQAKGLRPLHGQAVLYCVLRVEADDIMVGLHVRRLFVKQYSTNDTATGCQDWLLFTPLGLKSIKSHDHTAEVLAMGLFVSGSGTPLSRCNTHDFVPKSCAKGDYAPLKFPSS